MSHDEIRHLLDRFRAGDASAADRARIEQLLSEGVIDLEDIERLAELEAQVIRLADPSPSASLDKRFYEMLANERRKNRASVWAGFFSWTDLAPKLTLASFMLVVGLAIGNLIPSGDTTGAGHEQISLLTKQVSDLQEMMMLSLLEKGSATERLRAVGLTREMDEASKKVTSALIQTLNQDENVNVRLAALEALKPYAADNKVREELVRSIVKQESPLVQVSLAELMAALQEKSAVGEFEKIIGSENTPVEVKKKIRESIDVLI
ncbi:MAG: HEAT repeat domain-containing protein [Bacteroidota bacterium]|nr:HEAT repeat domain-containing protein [Bacteroidota bacterium]